MINQDQLPDEVFFGDRIYRHYSHSELDYPQRNAFDDSHEREVFVQPEAMFYIASLYN